jgi:hypothetical protein
MFLDLPDQDPLVKNVDPDQLSGPDPELSIIKQK